MAVGTIDITEAELAAAGLIPRGRHSLSPDEVAISQLVRLVRALAECVGERGYAHTTVAHVVARAGVSRRTFYEHFSDKEAAFLAAYDLFASILEARLIEANGTDVADYRGVLRNRLAAYLEGLAAEPALARALLVEVQGAGPAALARRRAIHERWTSLIEAVHAHARELDPTLPALRPGVARAALGAVHELVVAALERGEDPTTLLDLAEHVQSALLLHPNDHGAPS